MTAIPELIAVTNGIQTYATDTHKPVLSNKAFRTSHITNNVETAINKFPVSAISMGNVKLEACLSDDHQFVATQLLSFQDFGYKPVTEMVVYTGKTAEAFAKLFTA